MILTLESTSATHPNKKQNEKDIYDSLHHHDGFGQGNAHHLRFHGL